MPAPLKKVDIVKKRTKKFTRHQSDRYAKLDVLFLFNYSPTGENPKVLTTELDVDSRAKLQCPKLDTEATPKPDMFAQTVSKSLLSTMLLTLNY